MAIVVHKVTGPDAWRFICHAIDAEHRHHEPPTGWKWGYIATNRGRIVGVATVGRAVARALGPRPRPARPRIHARVHVVPCEVRGRVSDAEGGVA